MDFHMININQDIILFYNIIYMYIYTEPYQLKHCNLK